MILARRPGKGFNYLSVLIGLALLSLWIYYTARMTTVPQVGPVHSVLLLGFGAIFTLFVVKFICDEPAAAASALLAATAGTLFLLFVYSPVYPVFKLLAFMFPAAAVGVPSWLLLRDRMTRRLRIRAEELAVIYAMVVIGVGTSLISRSVIHGAANLWRSENQLEKWLPPHFLPAAGARDDVFRIAHLPPAVLDAPSDPQGALAVDSAEPAGEAFQDGSAVRALREKGARQGLFEGSARVPWVSWFVTGYGRGRDAAGWTFPAVFWTILILTFQFFFLFVVLIFRRRWIEEERLPFPLAQLPLAIIGEPAERSSVFRDRGRWIAFAVGVALTITAVLSVSPTATKAITPLQYLFFDGINSRIDLTGYRLVPTALTIVWLAPLALMVMLFVPLDVLFTVLLTFALTQVVIQWLLRQFGFASVSVPWVINISLPYGGAVGLAFWTIVFQWKEVERLFVAFARRTRGLEERGLLTLRNGVLLLWAVALAWAAWVYPAVYGSELVAGTRWLMLLGTGLAFLYITLSSRGARIDTSDEGPVGSRNLLILTAAMGFSFVALTLPGRSMGLLVASSALIFFYTFGSIRARGEVPMHEFYDFQAGRIDASLQARYVPAPEDPGMGIQSDPNRWWNTAPGVMSQFYTWHMAGAFRRWGPQNHFLDTFKIGHETGASSRDILRAIVLAMVVAALVTPALLLFVSYKYGYGGANTPMYWYQDYMTNTGKTYVFGTSSMEPPTHYDVYKMYTWPVVFFIAVGVIMYMRREYVWFPLHPVGFVMAGWFYQAFGSVSTMWFTLLAAYLVKRLIFRWFGVRFFREKVQPLLVFVIMGLVLGMVLYLMRYAIELGIGVFRWN